jgi:sorting nexin-4
MEYITGDRFAQDFIDRRKQALQSYLDRVSRHFVLQASPLLHKFLTLQDAVELRSLTRQRSNSNNSKMFENFTDVFINAFTRVKEIDPKFIAHKEMVDQFEESLTGVEKLHQKLLRLQSSK